MSKRIFLSPPYVGKAEREMIARAFDSGYVAPCGPQVDEFERLLAAQAGRRFAVAVASGTAALDLIMDYYSVGRGWEVFAPSLTFIATVGPACHRGAKLVFVDSAADGNIDVKLLAEALAESRARHKLVLSVDLYGRCADYEAIAKTCAAHSAIFVSDSAEAVGATRNGKAAGSAGVAAVYSFNGNKIITTSGGGAVLTDDEALARAVKSRSQQAREPFPWYEHERVGYNYRMSNLLGALGIAQLKRLPAILAKRAATAAHYRSLPFKFLPDVEGENHWLTILQLEDAGKRNALLDAFAAANIEARAVWKPMHLQPVFRNCKMYGGKTCEALFDRGVCLPSGTGLSARDLKRIDGVLESFGA